MVSTKVFCDHKPHIPKTLNPSPNWVKIMVTFWVPIIIRHLIFRVPKKGP